MTPDTLALIGLALIAVGLAWHPARWEAERWRRHHEARRRFEAARAQWDADAAFRRAQLDAMAARLMGGRHGA